MLGFGHSLCAEEGGIHIDCGAAIARASVLVLGQPYVRAGNPLSSSGGEVDAQSLVGLGDGRKRPSCITWGSFRAGSSSSLPPPLCLVGSPSGTVVESHQALRNFLLGQVTLPTGGGGPLGSLLGLPELFR